MINSPSAPIELGVESLIAIVEVAGNE